MTLTFKPDWVSLPGDTIADLLEEKDWSEEQLAEKLEYTSDYVSQLVNGKAFITEEVAVKLAKVLGGTENFWLNREANYRSQQQNIA